MQQSIDALKKQQQVMAAYNHAMGVISLDATTAAPADTWEGRGKTMETMSGIIYELTADPANAELYAYLEENKAKEGVQTTASGLQYKVLVAGDGYYVAPDELHGCVCLEEGILIDTFSPVRADFLKL